MTEETSYQSSEGDGNREHLRRAEAAAIPDTEKTSTKAVT